MHNAPAVSYPVGRSAFQAWVLLGLAALTAAVWLAWARQTAAPDWRHGVAGLLWLVASGLAWAQWWRTSAAQLAWDGQAWTLVAIAGAQAVVPEVVLDVQTALLLRLRDPDGGTMAWVWPQRRTAAGQWQALRRALFAAQPPGARQ